MCLTMHAQAHLYTSVHMPVALTSRILLADVPLLPTACMGHTCTAIQKAYCILSSLRPHKLEY